MVRVMSDELSQQVRIQHKNLAEITAEFRSSRDWLTQTGSLKNSHDSQKVQRITVALKELPTTDMENQHFLTDNHPMDLELEELEAQYDQELLEQDQRSLASIQQEDGRRLKINADLSLNSELVDLPPFSEIFSQLLVPLHSKEHLPALLRNPEYSFQPEINASAVGLVED